MCVAVIGGMSRLERHYIDEARKFGIKLRIFNSSGISMQSGIKNADAVILFTNKISHRAKREVMKITRKRDISVFMYHSCGVCTLRNCFDCLKGKEA